MKNKTKKRELTDLSKSLDIEKWSMYPFFSDTQQNFAECEDPIVIRAIIEECQPKYDMIKFPVYDQNDVYEPLEQEQIRQLKQNLDAYKHLIYVVTNYNDLYEILNDNSQLLEISDDISDKSKDTFEKQKKKTRKRRTIQELQSERFNFCYIQGCNRGFVSRKAVNYHIKKFHKKDEPVKTAEEMLDLQKTNPQTFLTKNYKRCKNKNVFKKDYIDQKNNDLNERNSEQLKNIEKKKKITKNSTRKINQSQNNYPNKQISVKMRIQDYIKNKFGTTKSSAKEQAG